MFKKILLLSIFFLGTNVFAVDFSQFTLLNNQGSYSSFQAFEECASQGLSLPSVEDFQFNENFTQLLTQFSYSWSSNSENGHAVYVTLDADNILVTAPDTSDSMTIGLSADYLGAVYCVPIDSDLDLEEVYYLSWITFILFLFSIFVVTSVYMIVKLFTQFHR